MNTKLYVSNFAITTTEKELRSLFSAHGNVAEISLPVEHPGGRPRGFAIVTMVTPQGAQAAMLALHGEEVEGRVLAVTEHVFAKKMPPVSVPNGRTHSVAKQNAGRVAAAGCFLPLSRNLALSRTLGTRHRAALGLSEESDAVVVVVSEETGAASVAVDGVIERALDGGRLAARLGELLGVGEERLAPARSLLAGMRRFTARSRSGSSPKSWKPKKPSISVSGRIQGGRTMDGSRCILPPTESASFISKDSKRLRSQWLETTMSSST